MLAVLPNVKFSKSLSNFFVICSLVLISISNSLFCCLQVSHQFSFLIFPLFSHTRHYSFICTTLFHVCHLVLASISVRYLGFESNFLFLHVLFWALGTIWEWSNQTTRRVTFTFWVHFEPPGSAQTKPYEAFNNAVSRRFFGNTDF